MPLYTYRCDACGREVDRVRSYDDREKAEPCRAARTFHEDTPRGGEAEITTVQCPGTLLRDGIEGHARLSIRWGLVARGVAPGQRISS